MCRHANISPSNLITLDDFPKYSEVLENVQFILVDHNKLQGELGDRYHSNVKGVIDHHDEENAVPRHTQPEPRIIEKCGSCTSLVARFCTPSWDAMSSSSLSAGAAHGQGDAAVDDSIVTEGWDAQMAQMALASILIDTANLTAPSKVQAVDEEAVEYLEAKMQKSPRYSKSWNRNQFYHEIDEAKRNIDALSLEEVLKKDYKQWTEKNLNLGISSVVKPLIYLTKKAIVETKHSDFQDTLAQFMESHSLDIFAIMTTSTSEEGEFTRELLVQAKEASFPALHEFVKKAVLALRLEEILIENIDTQREPIPGQIWRKIWLQKDVSQSRKQVAPMLRESILNT